MQILRIFNYGNVLKKLTTNFRLKFKRIKKKVLPELEIPNQIVRMFYLNN